MQHFLNYSVWNQVNILQENLSGCLQMFIFMKITLKLHQHVTVRVIGVDLARKRISLRLVR